MIRQLNSKYWHKLNGISRNIYLNNKYVCKNSILINEFPKSGGTWLCLMLSDLLSLPFARNRLPYLSSRQLFHGHIFDPSEIGGIPVIFLCRDGRDVIVSLYYHLFFYNDVGNKVLVDKMRSKNIFKNYEDIKNNLPKFIKLCSNNKNFIKFNWGLFINI